MKKPTSHNPRTLERLRELGYTPEIVEQTIRIPARPGKPALTFKRDLFGCIDVLGIRAGYPNLGVQVCSLGDHSKRHTKAIAEADLITWLAGGNKFEIWSWSKNAQGRWTVRVEELTGVQVMNERREAQEEAA